MAQERMCAVCRIRKQKNQLIRIARNKEGEFCVDINQKSPGRGAYICSKECCQKSLKTRALNRAFKQEVSVKVYEELAKIFEQESL